MRLHIRCRSSALGGPKARLGCPWLVGRSGSIGGASDLTYPKTVLNLQNGLMEPLRWRRLPFGMFDRVMIRTAPETEAAGIAGRQGVVHGITTVSVTAVEVIGDPIEDTAVAVSFEGGADAIWFSPNLVELVDHNPGTTLTFAGSSTALKREASGEWREVRRKLPLSERPAWVRRIFRRLLGGRFRTDKADRT